MSNKIKNIVVQVDAESTKMMLAKISSLNTQVANLSAANGMLSNALIAQAHLIENLDNRLCELEGNSR
jgi:flagellum-specific peptidoglycan hydrolase FlgJ